MASLAPNAVDYNLEFLRGAYASDNIEAWMIDEVYEANRNDLSAAINHLAEMCAPSDVADTTNTPTPERSGGSSQQSALEAMFPDKTSEELDQASQRFAQMEDIVDFLLHGEQEQHDAPEEGGLHFQGPAEKEYFEQLVALFPHDVSIDENLQEQILWLLRWQGYDLTANTIVSNAYTPNKIHQLVKNKKKKNKRMRQQQNTAEPLPSTAGKGTSFTSAWNQTHDHDAHPGALNDSGEFPRGSVAPCAAIPSVWSNSSLHLDHKVQSLVKKFPTADRSIIEDLVYGEMREQDTATIERHLLEFLGPLKPVAPAEPKPSVPYYNPYARDERDEKKSYSLSQPVQPKRKGAKKPSQKFTVVEKKKRHRGPAHDAEALTAKEARNRALGYQRLLNAYATCAVGVIQSGDYSRAKDYSLQGKNLRAKIDEMNQLAFELTQKEQAQQDSSCYMIDLHGLYRQEALEWVCSTLERFRDMPQSERPNQLKIVTGVGYHSGPRGSVLMPAVMQELKSQGLACTVGDGEIFMYLQQLGAK